MLRAIAIALAIAAVGAGPSGRYLGQDGADLVGPSATPGPSEVQDIHLALAGLPERAKVVGGTIKGQGGGSWSVAGDPGSWRALVVKAPGSSLADAYVEPYQVESGRAFEVSLAFDDGRSARFVVRGGRADPNLPALGSKLAARWLGQDGRDLAGAGPNVGPDGLVDARIALAQASARDEIREALIAGPGGLRWRAGTNPEADPGIDFVRDQADPTRLDLHFQPTRDLAGLPLIIRLRYKSGRTDAASVVAGPVDPARATAVTPAPKLISPGLQAAWLGQDEETGMVRLAVDRLPSHLRVVAADLGDGLVAGWSDRASGAFPEARPLTFRREPGASRAELFFAPTRDESAATMTLRLAFADGTSAITSTPGGPADPSRVSPPPGPTIALANPGDDLADLALRHGTVTLGPGTYPLDRPLVLDHPVTIRSEGDATLLFAQGPSQPPWTAAIKIRAGRTSLDRLAIRFAGPIRWDLGVGHGPALIGTTDDRDPPSDRSLAGLAFTRLDVESPPPATAREEAPLALRLLGPGTSGLISENTFRAGLIEADGGPWRVVGNRQFGPPAGTFAHALFSFHEPHDLLVARNRARPDPTSGKAWRWLVLTGRGEAVHVLEDEIEGIGPRDDDRVAHPNAPETILTESYRLHFEGRPSGVSADGRVLSIPSPQGGPAPVGAVVAILSGPEAGGWRRVALPLGPDAYLLDRPIDLGDAAVSIASGFTSTRFERNVIDDRGSSVAVPFVLAGDHFGTRLVGNITRGGGESAVLLATATERPGPWGWSHNPMFGLVVEGNRFEGATRGTRLAVQQNEHVRSSRGRTYMTATLSRNTLRGTTPTALVVGEGSGGDPKSLVVVERENGLTTDPAGPSARVIGATLNGRVTGPDP